MRIELSGNVVVGTESRHPVASRTRQRSRRWQLSEEAGANCNFVVIVPFLKV